MSHPLENMDRAQIVNLKAKIETQNNEIERLKKELEVSHEHCRKVGIEHRSETFQLTEQIRLLRKGK